MASPVQGGPFRGPVLSRHTKSRVGDPGSRRSAGLGRMTIMAVIGITGSTDGIGRATARVLRADGTASWFTHAVASGGNPSRKHRVATSLWWLATWRGLMTYVDWPSRPASTADRHVGAQRGRMGAG